MVFKHKSSLTSYRRSSKLFKPVPPTTSKKVGLVGDLNNMGKVGQDGSGKEVKEPSRWWLQYLSDSRLCYYVLKRGTKRPSEKMNRPHSLFFTFGPAESWVSLITLDCLHQYVFLGL